MTPSKRAFDLFVVVALSPVLLPLSAAVWLAILLLDGRPVFYGSERMRAPGQSFTLWKFRTMLPGSEDGGVSGGAKRGRITPLGRFLRRYRLDELPQMLNILRGDMSLVGPRPPLRTYVERFPGLYAEILRARPGLTGLATLTFRHREERLLALCTTAEETDLVYARRCVPVKARLDILYRERWSLCLDLWVLWRTLTQLVRR